MIKDLFFECEDEEFKSSYSNNLYAYAKVGPTLN
jgi:hypothetical protein